MGAKDITAAIGSRFAAQIALRFPEKRLQGFNGGEITASASGGRILKAKDLVWHTDGSHTHQVREPEWLSLCCVCFWLE